MRNKKGKTRVTTIVLAVCFVLLVLLSTTIFSLYPRIDHYILFHRKYDVYGGMTDELKDSDLFDDMTSGKSFCFMGDSITYGSETKGIHWYQPLIPYIKGGISDISFGRWTVLDLINQKGSIPVSDVYVIAIGVNDVWNTNDPESAKTTTEFVDMCDQLANILKKISPEARIYFIAPWTFIDPEESYSDRGNQFRTALREWCEKDNYCYINPDPIINSVLEKEGVKKYMSDRLHPNAPKGVGLFSYAVLMESHNQRVVQ